MKAVIALLLATAAAYKPEQSLYNSLDESMVDVGSYTSDAPSSYEMLQRKARVHHSRKHRHHKKHLVSIGEKLRQMQKKKGAFEYGVVRSTIGEKDGAEVYHDNMNTHSNVEDYKNDSPAGYTVPLEMKDATLLGGVGIRPLGTSTIGDPDADEVGDLKAMIDENSDSD